MQAQHTGTDHEKAEAEAITLHSRCQILFGQRLGTVRYVGKVAGLAPGYWVGVKLDHAEGSSNGVIDGQLYFEASEDHATFVRPSDLQTGEFPPEEQLDEEDMI